MRLIGLAVVLAAEAQQAGNLYRNCIRIPRVGFRRLVALGVIPSVALTGCASAPYYAHPDLRERSNQIASIAAITVDVRVLSWGLGGGQFSGEWSETARTNLRNAIAKHFGGDPRFAVKEFAPTEAEATQQELEQVRHVMEDILVARVDKGVACLPGPTLALADAAGTNALLLAYASDRIKTGGLRAAMVVTFVLVIPVFAAMVILDPSWLGRVKPVVGDYRVQALDTITLCLVDPRKGDVLWFHLQPIGTGNLLDGSHVERLIGDAYAKFREAAHQ
ncbi:MAG TPA: hypothetical protein VGA58_08505 [bacterium]